MNMPFNFRPVLGLGAAPGRAAAMSAGKRAWNVTKHFGMQRPAFIAAGVGAGVGAAVGGYRDGWSGAGMGAVGGAALGYGGAIGWGGRGHFADIGKQYYNRARNIMRP